MTIQNMAKVNMLIKKVYLLAGVIMAANMFVVNEVKAMEEKQENNIKKITDIHTSTQLEEKTDIHQTVVEKMNNDIDQETKLPNTTKRRKFININKKNWDILTFLLDHKYSLNFTGGFILSALNNYFKWWDYNAERYWGEFGCYGYRTKRFLKDYLQFEININLGRGAIWMLLYVFDYKMTKRRMKKNGNITSRRLIFNIVTGFISAPLTMHFYTFSIAVSFDSIICWLINKFLFTNHSKEKNIILSRKNSNENKIEGDNISNSSLIFSRRLNSSQIINEYKNNNSKNYNNFDDEELNNTSNEIKNEENISNSETLKK